MRFRFQYVGLTVFVLTTLAAWHSISTIGDEQDNSDRSESDKESNHEYRDTDSNYSDDEQEDEDTGPDINSPREEKKNSMALKSEKRMNMSKMGKSRDEMYTPEATNEHNKFKDSLKRWKIAHRNRTHKLRVKKEEDSRMGDTDHLHSFMPTFDADRIRSQSKTLVKDNVRHDKWIVLTTVSLPTDDVKFLANLTGWKVVVVGDTKTPRDWSYPNCVYLSITSQESMGLSITSKLPYRHYARKNVGYLYAIAHGAKVIYETDDDNRPLDKLLSFELEPTVSGLMFAGSDFFNPYSHFGQPTLWPRGFPLSKVGAEITSIYRLYDRWPTPAIQQGVVNGDPDMDAIFRLTRKLTLKPLDVRFDTAAPPALLPAGVFSPFNSQNTLFLGDAFWALLIPTTTTFRICDIWRGYWAQRLLWEIDGHLGFFPPNAYQQRNAHDYMADMEQEQDMYFNTDRLLSFLTQWECQGTLTFFQCLYKLSADMAGERFWERGDVEIARLWLEDLIRVGYTEPKRKSISKQYDSLLKSDGNNIQFERADRQREKHWDTNSTINNQEKAWSDLAKRGIVTLHRGTVAQFIAATQQPPTISPNKDQDVSAASRHADSIAKMCPGLPVVSTPTRSINKDGVGPFDNILLVVVFNWPFYGNVRYTETMYRPIFPNILYCGSNFTLFARDTALLGVNVSFIDADGINGGVFSHLCAVKAMQMNFNVKGYLFTSDDSLLNPWNFARFDKNKIWMINERYIFNVSGNTGWMWWPTYMGSPAYNKSMDLLRHIATSEERMGANNVSLSSDSVKVSKQRIRFPLSKGLLKPKKFLTQLWRNTGNPSFGVHAISDVYYIPERLRTSAVVYLSHFLAHHVFLELSVALTLYGLDDVKNFEPFNGVNVWMNERSNPWSRFTLDNHFLHPVKLSVTENLLPLCTAYFPAVLARGHNGRSDSSA